MAFADLLAKAPEAPFIEKYWSHARSVGLPHRRQESWKYLNFSFLEKDQWSFEGKESSLGINSKDMQSIEKLKVPDCDYLVFVNHIYQEDLSSVQNIEGLSLQFSDKPEVEECFSDKDLHCFSAISLSKVQKILSLEVKENFTVEKPVQVIHWQKTGDNIGEQVFSPFYTTIRINEGGQISILETVDGDSDALYGLASRVVDIFVGKKGVLDICRVHKNEKLKCVNHIRVHQRAESSFHYLGADIEGEFLRNDVNVLVDGAHCKTSVDGLYLTRLEQEVDNHTKIEQRFPECETYQLYKGILTDQSHGVFDGKIIICQDSQKIQAEQLNKNLLLGSKARVDTKPNLEIFADDVKASHGATIGQLEEEELFYLHSRGISKAKALEMVSFGFLAEVSFRLKNKAIKNIVEKWMKNTFQKLV